MQINVPPFLFPPRGKCLLRLLPPWGKVGKGVITKCNLSCSWTIKFDEK